MTATLTELSEDEFDRAYSLVPNHLNPSASWGWGDGPGCLFETYGEEFAFVRSQDPQRVWTLVDGDDGDMYLVNGLHFVNRVGYLLSRELVPEGTAIEVHIRMSTDDSDAP